MKNNFFVDIFKQGLRISMLIILFFSCEKDPIKELIVKKPPGEFLLLNPGNDNEFSALNVSFKWASSKNATDYTLLIQQGSTEVHKKNYAKTSATVALSFGTSYSWHVVASNKDGTYTSKTRRFTIREKEKEEKGDSEDDSDDSDDSEEPKEPEPEKPFSIPLPQIPHFLFIRDEASKTLSIEFENTVDYSKEGVSYTIEVLRKPCIGEHPECNTLVLQETRNIINDANLENLDTIDNYAITIIRLIITVKNPQEGRKNEPFAIITSEEVFYH